MRDDGLGVKRPGHDVENPALKLAARGHLGAIVALVCIGAELQWRKPCLGQHGQERLAQHVVIAGSAKHREIPANFLAQFVGRQIRDAVK